MQVLQWNGDMYPMIEFTDCSSDISFNSDKMITIYDDNGGHTPGKIGDYVGIEDGHLFILTKQSFIYSTSVKGRLK
jgi:hypothetical protein